MRSPKVFGSVLERIQAKYEVDDATGCWVWQAATVKDGYPSLSSTAHRTIYVHRWMYEHFVGPIPDGLTIDHLCRRPACVNPAHLEAVTMAENTARKVAARTHCANGHPISDVRVSPKGRRICRTCERDTQRRYQARRKGSA